MFHMLISSPLLTVLFSKRFARITLPLFVLPANELITNKGGNQALLLFRFLHIHDLSPFRSENQLTDNVIFTFFFKYHNYITLHFLSIVPTDAIVNSHVFNVCTNIIYTLFFLFCAFCKYYQFCLFLNCMHCSVIHPKYTLMFFFVFVLFYETRWNTLTHVIHFID